MKQINIELMSERAENKKLEIDLGEILGYKYDSTTNKTRCDEEMAGGDAS